MTTGVNPSLLMSFYNPAEILNDSFSAPASQINFPENRQPYEQQTLESSREKERLRKARQQQYSHTSTAVNVPPGLRPGLQRSNSDSGFKKNRPGSAGQLTGQSVNHGPIQRRPSPLKPGSQTPLNAIPEALTRPRTRLVIDESGRARTETDPGPSPTKCRSRHDGLDDDADSDSDASTYVLSRNNSFKLPSGPPRPTKHARIDSSESSNSGSIMRSSSSASMRKSGLARVGSIGGSNLQKPSTPTDNRRFSISTFGQGLENFNRGSRGSTSEGTDSGDAHDALKGMMGARAAKQGTFVTRRSDIDDG